MPVAAPSWDDLYLQAKAELIIRRPDLQVLDGDISDMLLAAIAAVGDRVVAFAADAVKATYVDGANGADLTQLADDHWNIARHDAVAAQGTVQFSRAAAVEVGTIPIGTVVATERDAFGNEVRYLTTSATSWLAAEFGPKDASVEAETAGSAGNIAATTITRIAGTLFDTFTVSNTQAMAGGGEAETDDSLRQRVRDFTGTLRRGTLAALEYGAKQVDTVAQAVAVEDAGIVTVYVTDAAGGSNLEMVSDVEVELEDWRAAGTVVMVSGGALYDLTPISITLAVRTGVDTAAITATVKDAIVARVNKLRIGETASRSIIQQAALNVDIDGIIGCEVVLPAADVVPGANEIIRTTTGAISVA